MKNFYKIFFVISVLAVVLLIPKVTNAITGSACQASVTNMSNGCGAEGTPSSCFTLYGYYTQNCHEGFINVISWSVLGNLSGDDPTEYQNIINTEMAYFSGLGTQEINPSTTPPSAVGTTPQCDLAHLNLCTTLETCIGAGGYWWTEDNACHSELPPEFQEDGDTGGDGGVPSPPPPSGATVGDCANVLQTIAIYCSSSDPELFADCNPVYDYYVLHCDNNWPPPTKADFVDDPVSTSSQVIEDKYDPSFESDWIMDPTKGTIACLSGQLDGCFTQSECDALGDDYTWLAGGECVLTSEAGDGEEEQETAPAGPGGGGGVTAKDYGTFCDCPAAEGSACEAVCKTSGVTAQGRACCCEKEGTEYKKCARVPDKAACNAQCAPAGAASGIGDALSAIDSFLGKSPIRGEMVKGDVPSLIGNVLKVFLGIIGSLALVIFIYGGVMWMTSGGNPDKVKKAQGTLVWSILGLVVIFSSYVLVSGVITALTFRGGTAEETAAQEDQCIEECKQQTALKEADCVLEAKEPGAPVNAYDKCLEGLQAEERSCRAACGQRYK